jgi:hypothetical protein
MDHQVLELAPVLIVGDVRHRAECGYISFAAGPNILCFGLP